MINKSILIEAFQLLDKSERKGAFVLVTLICLAGVCEFIALSSLMFVVSNITNPTGQVENKIFDYVSIIFSNVSHVNFVLYAIIFTIFALILVYSFNLFISHSCERYGASIQARMGNHLMNGILKIPYEWHLNKNKAELVRFFHSDISRWGRDFIMRILLMSQHIVGLIIPLLLLLIISPIGGASGVLVTSAMGYALMRKLKPKLEETAQVSHDSTKEFVRLSDFVVKGVRDIKLTNIEGEMAEKFSSQFDISAQSQASMNFWRNLQSSAPMLIGQLMMLSLAFALILSDVPNANVASILALVAIVAFRVMPAFNRFWSLYSSMYTVIPWVKGVINTYKELNRNSITSNYGQHTKKNRYIWEEISFTDVSYKYPGSDQNALNGISLKITRGKKYGVIGKSGSGKSTFLDILSGLYSPTDGAIRVDGKIIRANFLSELNLAYVSQAPEMLDGEIWENVALGVKWEEVDKSHLRKVLSMADICEFVDGLAKGIHTKIGYQGVSMSGGQLQRLSIARALYTKPSLLVLDEATSNLDYNSEEAIKETLYNLGEGMTLIIVAHNWETVRECDEIYLVDSGEKKDEGSLDELKTRNRDFFGE